MIDVPYAKALVDLLSSRERVETVTGTKDTKPIEFAERRHDAKVKEITFNVFCNFLASWRAALQHFLLA